MVPPQFRSTLRLTHVAFLFYFFALVFGFSLSSKAQYRKIVVDSFQVESPLIDVSKMLLWGSNTVPTSSFIKKVKSDKEGLRFQSICLTDSALKHGAGFTNAKSLKTCTAFDYRFPKLQRANDSILIEFDAYWDTLQQIGEGGRIVMALLYQYPEDGLVFGQVDSVKMEAPFGRPAYNIRILNRNLTATGTITAPGYFFYGGGKDSGGEFEKTTDWWLPGFIAQPGGLSPQTGPSYPIGATTKIYTNMASSIFWQHFTFKIFPEKIELWLRKSASNNSQNQRLANISIPKTAQGIPYTLSRLNQFYNISLSNLPLYYMWVPEIEAIRFYFRAGNQAYLANVNIGWSGSVNSSLEPNFKNEIELYPNPNQNGRFVIKDFNDAKFELYDLNGKMVFKGIVEANVLETGPQKPGIYFLKINGISKAFGGKIVFE